MAVRSWLVAVTLAIGTLAASLARGFARRLRLLRFGDRFAALTFELRLDVVVDPLLVPPLHRQNGDPVQIDAVVQMIARGQSGFARLAEDLPLLDRIADLDVDGAQVAIKRKEPKAVIQDDGIAVNTQVAGEGDSAAVGGFDGITLGDRQVVAEVIGGVDRFIVVGVGPVIREVGFDFGVAQLAERAFPKYRRSGFLRDRGDLVFVLFSEPLVDREKNIFRTALTRADVVQQGRNLALKKVVGYGDGALLVFDVFELVDKRHVPGIAGFVGCDKHGFGVRRHVIGMGKKSDEVIRVVFYLTLETREEITADPDSARCRIRGGLV